MEINRHIHNNKQELLNYFRNRANEILSELTLKYSPNDFRKKATAVNHAITQSKDILLANLMDKARRESWSNEELLRCVLMISYTNDVIMLETRNLVWEYDYMAFSRRIGELWEPFCKLCFIYPINNITLFIPPLFSDVKNSLTTEIEDYINKLRISSGQKQQLKKYYDKVWSLVTSGEIQLECDLHFIERSTKYIVDFKSGFGSNEKGNTNRLLLVGSIYNNIETENYKCLLFVRAQENNHYLDTLKESGLWKAYCGLDAYSQIKRFSGFDIHDWISKNVNWMSDFSDQMIDTIQNKKLNAYLEW